MGLLEIIKIHRGEGVDTLTEYMPGARTGVERDTLAELSENTQECGEEGMAGAFMSDSDASSCFCSSSIWSGGAFSGRRSGQSDTVAHLCLSLQERYRQDCNLAVQLLKCNKSHFRNHKFADVSSSPAEVGKKGS